MRNKKQIIIVLGAFALSTQALMAQRAMTVKDVQDFQRISFKQLSNDGKWVLAVTEPWRGDGDRNGNLRNFIGDATAKVYDAKGNLVQSFSPISNIGFAAGSKHVVLSTKVTEKEKEEHQLKEQQGKGTKAAPRDPAGTPQDARGQKASAPAASSKDLPMDKLIIYTLGGNQEVIDSLRGYKLADKSDWLAYQTGKKDSTLHVRNLGKNEIELASVTSYQFSADGKSLCFVASGSGINGTSGLFLLNEGSDTPILIKEGKGDFKSITFAQEGNTFAFLFAEKADKDNKEAQEAAKKKGMELWMSTNGQKAERILADANGFAPKGWIISENGRMSFSKNGQRLTFGTAPAPREVDKNILASNRPNVQVWSWDEAVQYTVQDYNKDRDSRKTYTAVYDLNTRKALQVATEELPNVTTTSSMNSDYVLLSTNEAYSRSSMWEGRSRSDYYSMNLTTGEKMLIKKADYTRYRLSLEGKYAYAYNEMDSVWRTIDMKTGQEYQLTDKSFAAWNTDNDVPDYAGSYGNGGWAANDEFIYLYDRYDIYKVPAQGGAMTKLTNGAADKIQFRFPSAGFGGEEKAKDPKEIQILTGWNETTKGYGYYRIDLSKPKKPIQQLMAGNYMLGSFTKAKNADVWMFTKETYEQFPELYVSDVTFKNPAQITHEGDQQNAFLWGTAELISWTSYKGKKLEGVIYKPANFDPNKKYPLLVNFYERNAETLYSYHQPQPHRSTPDYHLYNSNEYVVFNPDIIYTDGHPGESCYDCVMSGIDEVLKGGYIDEKRIGAAGHSWGGYQTAYLATRTDRFAALESGAPVVNMFSAFGGIRWGSGMARDFQYEHGQSRIGQSIWEAPELYKENSPLFNMDKVTTPLLIMHNDTDGHVPWYQGIEYTVALKRLNKVYWMLNYTGEPHWPVKMANRVDFQTRMLQFFNHYLKGEPMKKWMKEGVKAVDQPYELGY